MNKLFKKLFAPIAILSMALGVTISLSTEKNIIKTEAAAHSLTVTRANFASGALAYNVDDAWSVVDTAGNTVTGTFDLFSIVSQTTMQSKNTGIMNNFNNASTMLPGNLTGVKVVSAAGTSRTWTLYASTSTPLTLSNYASNGTNLGGKAVTGTLNAETSWTGITGTYKYLYLAISSGASFANSITVEYDIVSGSFGTLDHIELSTSGAQLQFAVSSTFSSNGLVVTAFDNSVPAFSKVVTGFTTDYDDHVFTLSDLGTKTVTVTYVEGVTKTATYDIEVVNLVQFSKITSTADLHFGATYIIVNEANNKVLGIDDSNTYRVSNDVTITSNTINDSATIQKFKLVISPVTGSYGFELLNGTAVGKYLNYTGSSNTLTTDALIDNGASWNIGFTDGNVDLNNATIIARKIGYNTSSPRFAAYTSAQSPIQLYLNAATVDHTVSATMVATEINSGKGNTAQATCAATLDFLNSAYGRLSSTAKNTFDTSSNSEFVSARARLTYLGSWVAANPSARPTMNSSGTNNLFAVISIGAIGLTSILAYFFLNKKKVLR